MQPSRPSTRLPKILAAALVVAACSDAVSPDRGRPGAPSFSFSPNGVAYTADNGTLGQLNVDTIIKGFNAGHPHRGDAIVATFVWTGSTNIIQSVTDVITDANRTVVGNTYHLVRYVTAANVSMATYVATGVTGFADPPTDPSVVLAVRAVLSQRVADAGVSLASFSGVEDNFTAALGPQVSSASGVSNRDTVVGSGPISVDAGALTYAVTMADHSVNRDPPMGFTRLQATAMTDGTLATEADFMVPANATTADPKWFWPFSAAGGAPVTWLATALSLNSATSGSTTGSLTVSASTTGSNLDADGYTATVDGGASQAIGINGSVTFSNLTAGSHTVVLSGVAANCTVTGGASQTVNVPSGGSATAAYSVSCAATTGSLTVTTSTSGSNLDPDGYTATVDGATSKLVPTNGSVTFTGLSAGSHTVVLSGVATNCTVSGGTSRTVNVTSGGTATVSYSISCTTPPGNLTVSASTTGSSLDPDGYTATVDGATSKAVPVNGSVTFTGLAAGSHGIVLSGVAANCTVSGGTSRTVTVPSGGTATVSYAVSCVSPNQAPVVNAGPDQTVLLGLVFTENASFTDPDNGPWTYRIDWGDGTSTTGTKTSAGTISVGHSYVTILPKNFTVKVTVTDSRGASGSDTKIVSVVLL